MPTSLLYTRPIGWVRRNSRIRLPILSAISECLIPAGVMRISPSTSSYLNPSFGVFIKSAMVAEPLVAMIVIVTPPVLHAAGVCKVRSIPKPMTARTAASVCRGITGLFFVQTRGLPQLGDRPRIAAFGAMLVWAHALHQRCSTRTRRWLHHADVSNMDEASG